MAESDKLVNDIIGAYGRAMTVYSRASTIIKKGHKAEGLRPKAMQPLMVRIVKPDLFGWRITGSTLAVGIWHTSSDLARASIREVYLKYCFSVSAYTRVRFGKREYVRAHIRCR